MNDEKTIYAILDLLKKAQLLISEMLDPPEPERKMVITIEKRYSRSGNLTWRADTDDGDVVYFRQQDKDIYVQAGIWDRLNELPLEEIFQANIEVMTVQEGDFHSIKSVNPEYAIYTE
jgi:hypothetical protein